SPCCPSPCCSGRCRRRFRSGSFAWLTPVRHLVRTDSPNRRVAFCGFVLEERQRKMKKLPTAGVLSLAALILAALISSPVRAADSGADPDAGTLVSAADGGASDGGITDALPSGDVLPVGDGGAQAGEAGAAAPVAPTPTPEAEPVAEPAPAGTKPPRGNRGAVV